MFNKKDENKTFYEKQGWGLYVQLGIELAFYVIIFFFLGYFLDIRFNKKPYFTITAIVFGILSVFYNLWKRFLK